MELQHADEHQIGIEQLKETFLLIVKFGISKCNIQHDNCLIARDRSAVIHLYDLPIAVADKLKNG